MFLIHLFFYAGFTVCYTVAHFSIACDNGNKSIFYESFEELLTTKVYFIKTHIILSSRCHIVFLEQISVLNMCVLFIQATVNDTFGGRNNVVMVKDSDFDAGEALDEDAGQQKGSFGSLRKCEAFVRSLNHRLK